MPLSPVLIYNTLFADRNKEVRKILSLMVLATFTLSLLPINTLVADNGNGNDDPVPNYGFIPNSWDASVSKVDLVNFEEVARYYTAPSGDGDPDVRSWRTNRIAMDKDGNAWVLNTGTDAFRFGPNEGLQGQVIRIQADTDDLASTHSYTNLDNKTPAPLEFETDDAVQVFNVGAINDMPRAIAVDADGYIWIGFYGSGELHKYAYDEAEEELNLVGGPYEPKDRTIRYYEMKFAPNGDLFISSRSSTPGVSGDFGIYRFDGSVFYHEQSFNSPYALLVAPDGIVYATSYNDVLRIRAVDETWSQVTISGARNLRGMQLDGLDEEKLWIAETAGHTGGNRVYWYKLGSNPVNSGYVELVDSNTPVGVGRDASGSMWAISRTDNQTNGFIEAIDPETKGVVGSIEVGPRPYAYGDFVVPEEPELYEICGHKYADWNEALIPLSGWEITLKKLNEEEPVEYELVATTTTDVDGKYCFTGLEEGEYKVSEEVKPGWEQVYPDGDVYEVTLPYKGDIESFDFHNTPEGKCGDETAWAAEAHPGETRFVEQGNWATYVTVDLKDLQEEDLSFPLYAGQHYLAGMLNVKLDNGDLKVQYTTEVDEDWLEHCEGEGGKTYDAKGWCGEKWTGLLEYHLHVVDDLEGFNDVQTYNRRTKQYGNPIPGQFDYKDSFYSTESETEWIEVGIGGFSEEILIAAHAVMQWCGYDCDALAEIEAVTTPIDTIEVDSRVIAGKDSNIVLEEGQKYRFKVSGTWQNSNLNTLDAECRLNTNASEWEKSYPRSLNLRVNDGWEVGNSGDGDSGYFEWGEECSPDNTYTKDFVGEGKKAHFRIWDGNPPVLNWYNDNSGYLTVEIYKVW